MPGQKAPTQEYESERERQMENIFTDFNFPNPRPLSKTIRHFLPGASQRSQFVTFTEKPNPVSSQTQQHTNTVAAQRTAVESHFVIFI